jgi:hypothetical protein
MVCLVVAVALPISDAAELLFKTASWLPVAVVAEAITLGVV